MVPAISLCKTGFHSFLYLNDTPLTIIPYFLYLLACWSASRSVLSLSCIIIRYLNIHRSAEAFSTCPAGGPTCTHFSSVIQAQVAQWWSICFSHPGPGLYPNTGGGRGNSSQVIWHICNPRVQKAEARGARLGDQVKEQNPIQKEQAKTRIIVT